MRTSLGRLRRVAKRLRGLTSANYTITYVNGTLTVTAAATATAVSSSVNPSQPGQSVTFTATVSIVAPGAGTLSGSVIFRDGAADLATVPLAGGIATFSTTTLAVGNHTITAVFASASGDFTGSTSPDLIQTVNSTTGELPAITGVSPNQGSTAGGTVVTISGSNFLGVTAVRFGTVTATSFTIISAGQITATAPVHASGVFHIQVFTASGASDRVLADRFTYLAPAISAVSPNRGSTAGGTVVTITGTSFVGITVVRFGGIAATSFTVVSATELRATTPVHASGFVHVRVANAGDVSDLDADARFLYLAPHVNNVAPDSGSTAGGTLATITGTNFVGITAVRFGGVPAASFTVVSATEIRATSPVRASGTVHVRVVNAGDISDDVAADQFTYLAPAISGLSPNFGFVNGGAVVTITGTSFVGVTAVRFGGVPATSFTVVSPTRITATAPAHAEGVVHVRVVNAGDTSDLVAADQFRYVRPGVTDVTPDSGPTAGGTMVTILGANFFGVTAVRFGGIAAASFTVVSPTQITAVSPIHAPSEVHVLVTASGVVTAATAADRFTYLAPRVAGLTPDAGSTAGGILVTINGANFTGTTAVRFGTVAATSFTVVSPTRITAQAPAQASGVVDIRVVNAGATSAVAAAGRFTYAAPAVRYVFPDFGPTAGGTLVVIAGSHFVGVTVVRFGGVAANFAVLTPSWIIARAPAHAAGVVHVQVSNVGDSSDPVPAAQFTYVPSPGPGGSGGGSGWTRVPMAETLSGEPHTSRPSPADSVSPSGPNPEPSSAPRAPMVATSSRSAAADLLFTADDGSLNFAGAALRLSPADWDLLAWNLLDRRE